MQKLIKLYKALFLGLVALLVSQWAWAQCPMPATTTAGTNDSCFTAFDKGKHPYTDGYIHCMARQTDGKVLVGGQFNQINGVAANGIARLNVNGTLDNTFALANPFIEHNGSGKVEVYAITLQPDGKILIGGLFKVNILVGYTKGIARLLTNGNTDGSFNAGLGFNIEDASEDGKIVAIAVQADGKILAGGRFGSHNGYLQRGIGRMNSNGSRDVSFAPNASSKIHPYSSVYSIVVQTDTKIVVGGDLNILSNTKRTNIMRIQSTGAYDNTFTVNPSWKGSINDMILQTDGKLVLAGVFNEFNGVARNSIARVTTAGALDAAFSTGGGFEWNGTFGEVRDIVLQADGKILATGRFDQSDNVARTNVCRLTTAGAMDATFNATTTLEDIEMGEAVVYQTDGKVLVAGSHKTSVLGNYNPIFRLTSAGVLDDTYIGTALNNTVYAVKALASGKILVGNTHRYPTS